MFNFKYNSLRNTLMIFISLIGSYAYSQGYNIKIEVKNLPEKKLYLAYHYNGEIFKADSLTTDKNGQGTFSGKKELPGGMYILYFPSNDYFEFILSDKQKFEIKSDTINFLKTVRFIDSPENSFFFVYQKKLNELLSKRENLIQELYGFGADSAESYRKKITNVQIETENFKQTFINDNKNFFSSKLVKATLNPKMPDFSKKPDLMPDSIYVYNFYKSNFFENIDFNDLRFLRTSILYRRLSYFTENLMPDNYDSIMVELDRVLDKTKVNKKMSEYVLTFMFEKYRKSSIITHENVAVYLAEKYYLGGDYEISDALRNKMQSYVKATKPSLVGNIAPDLNMQDINDEYKSITGIKARYTIVYFFEPDCEICIVETPKLKDIYKKYKDKGIEVYAVYPFERTEVWKEYVEENNLEWINVHDPDNYSNFRDLYNIHGTPTIFLLNSNKRIIIKYISVEQLDGLLSQFLSR